MATTGDYARLEERILARDQVGASAALYDLMKDKRPVTEIVAQTVRIHAPYTHVPYHQRLDDGMVKFVNNDHCLLSERVALPLMSLLPSQLRYLPLAQSVWYMPTGLDPWNQLLGKAPGHYTRLYEIKVDQTPPKPEAHWPDQEPVRLDGPIGERLNHWLTLVQRGDVLPAYRGFLGLMEDAQNRRQVLAHLAFAGLIDVQDRMLHNRSYTTGHKSFRARATVQLARMVGWEHARSILYAGVPDIAVGPRWYSNYEMACQIVQNFLDNRDRDLLANDSALTAAESLALVEALLSGEEPAYMLLTVELLKEGKGLRQILDTIQLASAQLILETGDVNNYSIPQHSYEYCNTLRWFFDTFDHPHRLKLLFVAAAFVCRGAHNQRYMGGNGPIKIEAPRGADAMPQHQLLERLDEALMGLRAFEAVNWTAAYLKAGFDRAPLIETLATAAAKTGNDPHNQELGSCLLEDYAHSTARDRDRLLLAQAKHTGGHRKYGDHLEAYRRFSEAFGLAGRR